jgi:hypothetical protein
MCEEKMRIVPMTSMKPQMENRNIFLEHYKCKECNQEREVKDLAVIYIEYRGFAICVKCLAALHSMTSPLSVLVQTGLKTEE